MSPRTKQKVAQRYGNLGCKIRLHVNSLLNFRIPQAIRTRFRVMNKGHGIFGPSDRRRTCRERYLGATINILCPIGDGMVHDRPETGNISDYCREHSPMGISCCRGSMGYCRATVNHVQYLMPGHARIAVAGCYGILWQVHILNR
ncbi:hypothetical protein GALMADRAFT_596388 [Galerina marginata CBS 339.88]|uniref:Uncharacterized protein n=1 Tax=Galerina marginata (strain CBS 339.88) TaxID=685588 RepID=A0A067T249_GALM3|nr:hypothetical protein GALMADRAFT_596388 [Galerina marginata CBS 339.88]